jgi:hypothetical protein
MPNAVISGKEKFVAPRSASAARLNLQWFHEKCADGVSTPENVLHNF